MPTSNPRSRKRWPTALLALQSVQFRWLLAGNGAFFLAMQGQVLTRTFLAWDLTGEEMSLAYVNLAFAIPMLLFSLVGGAVSDRVERRRIIMTGQWMLICLETAILLLLFFDMLAFWHLLLAGSLSGSIIPFLMPARSAIIFRLCGAARLGNAMALNGSVMNLARVAGPAMMGFVIHLFSPVGAYAIAVVLFTTSWLTTFGVERQPIPDTKNRRLLEDMLAGFHYLRNDAPLLACLLFGMLPMLLAMPFQNLLVLFADQVWQVGERGLGILMAIAGLGGFIGSFWVARYGDREQRIQRAVTLTVFFALFLGAFSLTPGFTLALLPLLLANACASASQTLNNTISQLLVDDHYRGRMSSFMMMAFGLTPLGVLPLAYLAQTIGPQYSVVIACTLLVMTVAIFYHYSAMLRTLDDEVIRRSDSTR